MFVIIETVNQISLLIFSSDKKISILVTIEVYDFYIVCLHPDTIVDNGPTGCGVTIDFSK
jgi:hypothetical protein